jgi:predicted DNA binding CopG/RHH family protein
VKKTNLLTTKRPSAVSDETRQRAPTFEEEEARINFTVPASLHAKVKVRAAEKRTSIRNYFLELLERDGVKQ